MVAVSNIGNPLRIDIVSLQQQVNTTPHVNNFLHHVGNLLVV
jgi:hypothetical protein